MNLSHATPQWLKTLKLIVEGGNVVAPRGRVTHELLHHTFACDMANPVVTSPARALSYKFMAAEALWILAGDNTVDGIAPYNKHITQFSDDGVTFFGAYGPRVVDQLDYVVNALVNDRETRQAVLTTWRPNPPKTRDVPCTVALTFMIRDNSLHCHVFMRSSDVWLGLPYDTFNFSMIAARVACLYNLSTAESVQLGMLFLTAASSHLYDVNNDAAYRCLQEPYLHNCSGSLNNLVLRGNWRAIELALISCRDNHSNQYEQPWWIRPVRAT